MFSWLARSQELPVDSAEDDARLVWLWAAWNAIYGTWNEAAGKPEEDLPSQERCLMMLYEADARSNRHLQAFLIEHKKLASALCGDLWLSRQFWSEGKIAAEKMPSGQKGIFSRPCEKRDIGQRSTSPLLGCISEGVNWSTALPPAAAN